MNIRKRPIVNSFCKLLTNLTPSKDMPALVIFNITVVVHIRILWSIEAVCQVGQWDRLVGLLGNPVKTKSLPNVDEVASVTGNQKTHLYLKLYFFRAEFCLVICNVSQLLDDFAFSQRADRLAWAYITCGVWFCLSRIQMYSNLSCLFPSVLIDL